MDYYITSLYDIASRPIFAPLRDDKILGANFMSFPAILKLITIRTTRYYDLALGHRREYVYFGRILLLPN